jgi:hypothetical protein
VPGFSVLTKGDLQMAHQDVVDAYALLYTQAQLEAALTKALGARAGGVTVVSIQFEGGGHQGVISGNPEQIISELMAALDIKKIAEGDVPSRVTHLDFSTQRLGT